MSLRVVYMGTPDFAVGALESIIAAGHDVVGVLTNPDRPSGRGKKLTPSPVKRAARAHGIEVYQPGRVRGNDEALETLRSWNADVAVVAAYGQILPQSFLDTPRLGCINIHASLLPKYRGAAPINWCIIRGEDTTGVTTMQMDAGLDTGDMLQTVQTPIGPLETAGELHDRLAIIGADLIVETLSALEADELDPEPQDNEASSYAPMMSKSDGRIDWTATATDVSNLVRGVHPWPGGYTFHDGDRIKVHLARPVDGSGAPGEVIVADKQLIIAAGDHAVECITVQAPGSRAMSALDFLNGYDLSTGDVFE